MKKVAFFISSHGFGHAARCCAVMEALHEKDKSVIFEIFTTVPQFFFCDSLPSENLRYHNFMNDAGLIQHTPLEIDICRTVEIIDSILPFSDNRLEEIRSLMDTLPDIIISDISPMGLVFADKYKIPSILQENFTWDWIYEDLIKYNSRFETFSNYLAPVFNSADIRVQLPPVCRKVSGSVEIAPVSRKIRKSSEVVKSELNISTEKPVVLITMGGFSGTSALPEALKESHNYNFIITGQQAHTRRDNIITLPKDSPFFHPDLVNASDIVVGKPGYSTIAEVYNTKKKFGYFPRPGFREAPVLENFIDNNIPSVKLDNFEKGEWISSLRSLTDLPDFPASDVTNGAESIAEIITNRIG